MQPVRFFIIAIIIAAAAPADNAPGGVGTWRSLPAVSEGLMAGIETSAAQPGRVWLRGSHGGVWRSDDRGDHWQFAGTGLPRDAAVSALAASPVAADVAWCAPGRAGIWRTTDAGAHWTAAPAAPGGTSVTAILPGPAGDLEVLVGTKGAGNRGVWRTTDGGGSWAPAMDGLLAPEVQSLVASRIDPALLLVATRDGVARSTDGGGSWQWVYLQGSVDELEWGASTDLVWARRSNGVFASTDAGLTWAATSTARMESLVADPADPARLFGGMQLAGCGWSGWGYFGSVRLSTDSGSTFTGALTGACDDYIRQVAIEPADPTHVYAVFGSGAWRSDAAGASGSWTRRSDGLATGYVYRVGVGPDGAWVVRSGPAAGYARSTDAGLTWVHHDVDYCTWWLGDVEISDAVPGLLWECGDATCSDVGNPFLRRSTDGGATWWPERGGPPGVQSWVFLVATNHGNAFSSVVFAWGDDRIPASLVRSIDGGNTFTDLGSVFRAKDAVLDAANPFHVAALAADGDPVRVTTDGGETWSSRSAGLPRDTPVKLLVDPDDGNHVLVAFETRGVHESTDGGMTWTPVPFGGAGSVPAASASTRFESRVPAILDAEWDVAGEARRIFLATRAGPWIEGAGFVTDGLPSFAVTSMAYDRGRGVLLLGTSAFGLFALDVAPAGEPVALGGSTAPLAVSPPSAPTLEAAPNPSRGAVGLRFSVPAGSGAVSLDVYDTAGRHVRALPVSGLPGTGTTSWDGRDGSGRPAAAGLYFVRLRAGDDVVTRRILRLR